MEPDLRQDYFALFGLPRDYNVALDLLSARYRELQARVHPDRFAAAGDSERRLAAQWAAHINEAYRTLKDPLQRARYMLQLRGVRWDDEAATLTDPQFLMEQMELRERLGEAEPADLPVLLAELEARIEGIASALGRMLANTANTANTANAANAANADLTAARRMTQELQFFYRLRTEAENQIDSL